MVGIALFDMPYGYYMLLRLVVCGVSLWLIYHLWGADRDDQGQLWLLGGVALLYNPLVPIYLYSKGLWVILNLLTLALFVNVAAALRRTVRADPNV